MNAEIVDIIDVHIDDLQELQVNMDMPEPLSLTMDLDNSLPTQEKSITIAKNGSYAITPDPAYTLKKVDVEVAVSVPYLRPKYVTFWDFMGNILAAYDEDEVATIDYPTPPDYSSLGLTHYGWSETLEDIRTTKKALDVVCRYESDTEKIHIDILVDGTEFYLGYSSKFDDPYIVNWGDGSAVESIEQSATHIYNKGSYVIEVVPPAQAEGVDNHTQVFPTEVVTGYIADKNKAYTNGCPLWHKQGSLTSASFFSIRWLVHSYRYIIKKADNVYYGTYYRNIPVNDLKGRWYQGTGTFNGKVMTAMEVNPGANAVDIRIANLAFDPYGRHIITYGDNCYNAEYVYFPEGALQRANIRFYNWWKIRKIEGIPEIEIKGRTTMNSMFNGCQSLQTLDCGKWDVSSVTTMVDMFCYCTSLQTLDLSGWDVSSVTTMNSMFYSCYSLQTLDCGKWDVSSVTDMNSMFNGCQSLQTLDVSGWDVSSVTTMRSMFNGCTSLQTLDVSGWDVSKVTTIRQMFNGCTSLQTLDVSGWDVSKVTTIRQMFNGCTSLQTLDVSGWDVSKVTTIRQMFNGCTSLQTLDVSGWDVSSVTDMYDIFYNCQSLQTLIGDHTLEEVEAGEVTALNNAGKNTYIQLRYAALLRYSSLLAVAKGAYDRKAAGLSNQTYYVNRAVYNACYNDDGTTPDAATIAARQAELTTILTTKGYNIALS